MNAEGHEIYLSFQGRRVLLSQGRRSPWPLFVNGRVVQCRIPISVDTELYAYGAVKALYANQAIIPVDLAFDSRHSVGRRHKFLIMRMAALNSPMRIKVGVNASRYYTSKPANSMGQIPEPRV